IPCHVPSASRPPWTGRERFTVVSAVRMCAAMSSSPSAVWLNCGSPSRTSRAKKASRSRHTSGSAFSWMSSEAEVWRKCNVSRPSRNLFSAIHPATSSVNSTSPRPRVAMMISWNDWRSIFGVRGHVRAFKAATRRRSPCFLWRNRRALVGEHFFEVGIARLAGVERLLIMPAGQLRQRRFLAQINHGEIVVRRGVSRIDMDGFPQRGFTLRAEAFVAQGDAEVILDFGIFRVNGGGAAQGVERLVVFFLAKFQIAERGKIVGIVGALDDGGFDVFLRVGQFVLLQLDGRKVRQREAVVLVAVENFLVVRCRLIEFAPGKMLLRGGDEIGGTGGQFMDGFSDRFNRPGLRPGRRRCRFCRGNFSGSPSRASPSNHRVPARGCGCAPQRRRGPASGRSQTARTFFPAPVFRARPRRRRISRKGSGRGPPSIQPPASQLRANSPPPRSTPQSGPATCGFPCATRRAHPDSRRTSNSPAIFYFPPRVFPRGPVPPEISVWIQPVFAALD